MPQVTRCPHSGALLFTSTEEEQAILDIKASNESLQKDNQDLKKSLEDMAARLKALETPSATKSTKK